MDIKILSTDFEGRPYATLGYFTAVWERLRKLGLPVKQVAAQMGFDERELDDVNRLVDARRVDAALNMACLLAGDDLFCLKAGMDIQPMHLGALGHFLLSCTSIAELVVLHTRYGRLVTNAYPIEYEIGPGMCKGVWLTPSDGKEYGRHTVEFNLAAWMQIVRTLSGRDIAPAMVELPYELPVGCDEYERFFKCPVHFNAPQLAVSFPAELMPDKLRHGHSALRKYIEPELQRQLDELKLVSQPYHGFLRELRLAVTQELASGAPSLPAVAEKMGCSVRKVQRLLQAQEMTFRGVVDEVRQSLAADYIANPTLSFCDIAMLLGFSDQSTFQRAFRRWFACTPKARRNHLLQLGRLTFPGD